MHVQTEAKAARAVGGGASVLDGDGQKLGKETLGHEHWSKMEATPFYDRAAKVQDAIAAGRNPPVRKGTKTTIVRAFSPGCRSFCVCCRRNAVCFPELAADPGTLFWVVVRGRTWTTSRSRRGPRWSRRRATGSTARASAPSRTGSLVRARVTSVAFRTRCSDLPHARLLSVDARVVVRR